MGLFKKKDNKKNTNDDSRVKTDKKYHYRVYIKEIEDNYTHKKGHFMVERYIDESKGTVMLRNEETKFNEPKPSNDESYKIYKLKEVDQKILKLEKDLSKELKIDDPNVNRKDIEEELKTYKGIKRSLELRGKGSYLNIDEDGTPYFVFRRKGNFKLPEYDNVDIDTIYTPTEAKIKKGSELLDMKREKYSRFQRNLTTIVMTFFIIQMFLLGGLAWWSFKLNGLSNDSAITKMQNQIDETALYCANKYGEAGKNFYDSSLYVKNITETLVKDLHKEQAVIQGISPE